MSRKQRKPLIPDESPLEFFQAIKIPEGWRFIEKDKFQYAPVPGYWSYGYWYWVDTSIKVRIVFSTPQCRGGLLVVDMRYNPPRKQSLLDNKQSKDFNIALQEWNEQRIEIISNKNDEQQNRA